MLDPVLNDKVTNTMSTLAVAQLLADNLPSLIKINKTGSELFGISTALDLTLNLLDVAGISYDELVNIVTDVVNGKAGKSSLTAIDEVARTTIVGVLDAMISCANSPIIGNDMLDRHTVNGTTVQPDGVVLNLNVLDIFNKFSKLNPTDLRGGYYYGDTPEYVHPSRNSEVRTVRPSDTWKSGDLDSFIWYTMNMVTNPNPDDRKTYWDDRISKYKKKVEESTTESYDMFLNGQNIEDINGDDLKLNKLFRIEFDDKTNNFHVYLNPEKYQNKDGVFNKTIYTFNNDYMKNVRLLYPKPIIAGMLDVVANGSISLSANGGVSMSLPESILNSKITEIIENVIESDDTNIEDCYFTFSNNEYNDLIRAAELKRKGIKTTTGDTISADIIDTDELLSCLDEISPSATLQEQKTIIKNAITELSGGNVIDEITDNPMFKFDGTTNYANWNADSFKNKALQLLKALIQKIVESVITPKIVLIYLINYSFANGNLPKTPLDFITVFINLLKNIIIAVLDELINYLFELAMDKIKKLIAIYISQIALEKLQKYKDIIVSLVENCALVINLPSTTELVGQIDNVRHADILETKDTPGDTNC